MEKLKTKKVPMRMCVACREMKAKKELVRVVRSAEGAVSIDRSSKAPGRGAYLCNDMACFERAIKTRALERALSQKIDDTMLQQIKEELIACAKE